MSWLDTVKDGSAHEEIDDLSADLLSLTETVIAGSLLLGYGHATEKSDFADDTEPVVFEEALRFLQGKIPMPKAEWKKLEPKVRFRAFTVARLAQLDYIEALRGRLTHAVKKGETWAQSWQDVRAIAEADGAAIKPGYWETVYRTNVQTAYNAGRLMQYQNNPPQAWQLLVIEDMRTSNTCRPLAAVFRGNNALPANHSFWKTYGFPPYHFNCRTVVRAVHKQEAGRETAIENIPMNTIRKQFRPQSGFGGNPLEKESWWKITPEMIARADKYGITVDIVVQALEFDMQNYFPELLQGYDHIYTSGSHGYVYIAKNRQKNEEEVLAAKRLADKKHKIYLLPTTYKKKNPDMIIDNEIGEMKGFGFDGKIPTLVTIKSEIHEAARKQRGRFIYLHISDEMDPEIIISAVKSEIGRTPIKKVFLDHKGVIKEYTRKFFFNKRK